MRALSFAALVLALAGCPTTESGSVPDPRFGVLVFETNDRPFSRAPPMATFLKNDGHVLENRGRVAVAADGSVYVLIGLDSGRPFGTANDVTASRVVVKKVSVTGVVSDVPAPVLGSGGDPNLTAFQVAGDGVSPVIIDLHEPQNPGGRYLAVSMLDGTAWKTVSFLRSDRAEADVTSTWNPIDDQLRVLRPGVVVVQHGNTLVRSDGAGWTPVTLPPKVKELRLGTADAQRVRAYWLTTDGVLETDVLNGDGSWVGSITRVRRGTAPSLVGAWGFAGDLDTFTVHFVSTAGVVVMRHEAGVFRLAGTRGVSPGELAGTAYLVATKHPQRSAFMSQGSLAASFAGRETGPLGSIIGFAQGAPVTCGGDVPVTAKAGATCVPRVLHALDYRLSDDVLTLVQLFADEHQDATLRYFLKRIPLPSNNGTVTVDVPALDGGFPGESSMVMAQDQLFIGGHVLRPGATEHGNTSCTLLRGTTSPQPVEAVMTDADGSISFSPVLRGDYQVQCTRTGFATFTVSYTPAQVGPAALDGVLLSALVAPDDTPLGGAVDLQLDGGVLTRRDSAGTTTLSTGVAAGDSVRLLGTDVVWKEASGGFRLSSNSATFPAPRAFGSFRRVSNSVVVAQGVPDGQAPLSWTLSNGTSPLLSGPAVEVADYSNGSNCGGTVVWTSVGPGDLRAQRGGCQLPITLDASTLSSSQVPPMQALTIGPGGVFGFVGDGCGAEGRFLKACPVDSLNVFSGGPLVSAELSPGAIDARTQIVPGLGSRVVVLERSGALGTLRASAPGDATLSVVVQAAIPLPASWLPGETPLTFLDASQQRFLVRTDAEVYGSLGTAGSWTRVATNARAVFAGGFVLQNDGTLLRVTPAGAVETLPLRGNENLRFSAGALISDAAEMTCPDGTTCRVVQRMTFDKVITSLGAGRLTPDVVAQPTRFGSPTPRDFTAEFVWPTHRATLPP